ncbi:hypothetical protein DM02DRAFT_667986 [Periconia macrospinosa]|uniref:Transcription factor domain-containing protein n=1 Tax=Periconia macrospinosa TaxID=97972 RepID=A0A2V1E5Y7_9PLEO|nr:hypothetical protein DM02DRAFT_667986 [Periconia macrospinosa]
MEFCFVDNNTPLDRRSQSLVRSHAMKGKNLGRTIRARGRRGRQRQLDNESGFSQTEVNQEDLSATESGRKLLPKISNPRSSNALEVRRPATSPQNNLQGSEMLYFVTPKQFNASSRYLFYECYNVIFQSLYPRIFCRELDEAKISFFEMMIGNPSVFHCALGMTGVHLTRYLGHRDPSPESIRHFTEAMRLLRRELSSKSEPQDSSLAVIASLAIHADFTHSTNECRIHLQGLKHMIDLRPGGFPGLCLRIPEVGNKIRRVDLDLALMVGSSTLLGSQPSPLPPTVYVAPINSPGSQKALPFPLYRTSEAFQTIIRDTMTLCDYAGRAQLGAFQYQNILLSIFQRLVDFSPLNGPRPLLELDDICQLGFLAFINTLVNYQPQMRSICPPLLSEMLEARILVFSKNTAPIGAQHDPHLCLWLIFIYAISAPDFGTCCDEKSPIAQSIYALAVMLTLKEWEDVHVRLSEYPWISEFHDEMGRRLWKSITCL